MKRSVTHLNNGLIACPIHLERIRSIRRSAVPTLNAQLHKAVTATNRNHGTRRH